MNLLGRSKQSNFCSLGPRIGRERGTIATIAQGPFCDRVPDERKSCNACADYYTESACAQLGTLIARVQAPNKNNSYVIKRGYGLEWNSPNLETAASLQDIPHFATGIFLDLNSIKYLSP